jgi:predicted phosphodiesterase
MRIGLISDIHGNLHALDAAIKALRQTGVDRFVCAGDLVGYGPFPNECVERIAGLDAVTVAGNHDLIALGRLSDERCIPLASHSLRWTRDVLRDDARAYLQALPLRLELAEGVVVAHGSLDDPQECVSRPLQAAAQLTLLAVRHPDARHLVLGHTHRQMSHTSGGESPGAPGPATSRLGGGTLTNPGSVGQSRERAALARFAVLDLATDAAVFLSAAYDVSGCRAALRKVGLPAASCHLAPSRLAGLVRRARGLAALAVRRVGGAPVIVDGR